MASHGFGAVPLEGLIAFLHELNKGEWASDDISTYAKTKQLPEVLGADTPFMPLKLDLYLCITEASQVAGSDLSVVLKRIDIDLDTLQERLELRLNLKLLEGSSEEMAAATRCQEKLVVPGIRGMSYRDEIANAKKQVLLSTQPAPEGERPLSDDVALLGLTSLILKIGEKAEELNEGLAQSELTPSMRLLSATRACIRALNHTYETLQRLERMTSASSALAQSIKKRREPLDELLLRYRTTPTLAQSPSSTALFNDRAD